MPGIAGDAALIVDPSKPEDLVEKTLAVYRALLNG